MNDLRTMTDEELGSALGGLGREIAWPTMPDLAPAVMARITGDAPGPLHRTWFIGGFRPAVGGGRAVRRSLALAIIALLATVAIVTAFGVGVPGIRIFFGPVTNPTPGVASPTPSVAATSSPAGSPSPTSPVDPTGPVRIDDPTLGRLVSLDAARSGAGFVILIPTAVGFETPDAVQLLGAPPVARVSLSYWDRGSVTEFVGSADPLGFQKMVGGGTTVEPLTIDGSPAYWITGAPHDVTILYTDGSGSPAWETIVVEGNVLVWQDGQVTFRLVTPMGRVEAVAFAASMH